MRTSVCSTWSMVRWGTMGKRLVRLSTGSDAATISTSKLIRPGATVELTTSKVSYSPVRHETNDSGTATRVTRIGSGSGTAVPSHLSVPAPL